MALELLARATSMESEMAVEGSLLSMKNKEKDDEEEDKPFSCPMDGCTRQFSSKRNLVDHCRGHHQGTKPHVCRYAGCGKSFLRPAHLLIHTRIHTGEKPFVCDFEGCGKRWNQKSALKQHLRSHTGEKPYHCTLEGCAKKFSTSSSCKRHIATHDNVDHHSHRFSPYSRPIPSSSSIRDSRRNSYQSSGDEAPASPPASPETPSSPILNTGVFKPTPTTLPQVQLPIAKVFAQTTPIRTPIAMSIPFSLQQDKALPCARPLMYMSSNYPSSSSSCGSEHMKEAPKMTLNFILN